jgi:hypothetical protein
MILSLTLSIGTSAKIYLTAHSAMDLLNPDFLRILMLFIISVAKEKKNEKCTLRKLWIVKNFIA